jgi:DNA polymerase I-like protein with 3'-5' exonuclease and polymerase domains
MALFDMPIRQNSRVNDMQIVKQSKIVNKATPSIKGGSSLLDRINQIKDLVQKYLGHHKYILIQDEQTLHNYIDECIKQGVISIDTETTGLDPMLDDIAGICIYTPSMQGAYIPINHISYITNMKISNQLDVDYIRTEFERIIEKHIDVIMFNAKFDIRVLRNRVGLHNIYCTWDCYLAQRLLNENEPSNALKKLHQKYVLNGTEEEFTFDELFKGIPFTMIPLQTAVLYAGHDPVITYELYDYQRQFLREDSDREDMRKLYWVLMNIEMPCVDAVCNMEDNGVLFDMNYQQELSEKYNKLLTDKLEAFYSELKKYDDKILEYKAKTQNNKLDEPINIASPTQLAILFYDIMGCESVDKKSPRGTGEDILKKLDNPIADAVLEWRSMSKLVDTYIDKLPNCVNPNDGRIHCSFNQYGADTGRMSSSNPNLQNIPSHNKDIRKMFIASPGYVLMSSDYSQQEPSCLATFCKQAGAENLFNARFKGNDLYSEVASACFNKSYEECKEFNADGTTNTAGKERRNQAKPILLGILYGRGDKSVAEQLHCSLEDAQKLKSNLFRKFPEINKFEKDSLAMGRELGYVTTVCGRKRRLPALQLDEYEFQWLKDYEYRYESGIDEDLLNFDFDTEIEAPKEIPERTIRKYLTRLHNCRFNEKKKIFKQANEEGIWIVDNGVRIADATRQTVNARIQGSAADLTKLAMIDLNKNERLKELGFRLLIPVHDEIIAECPEENVKECSKLLAETMSKAAEKILKMPFSCDVAITKAWYGEEIEV